MRFQTKIQITCAALLGTVTAWGQIITGNNTGYFNDSTIQTNNFAAGGAFIGAFLPDGAKPFGTGRGVEVAGNKIYYTLTTGGVVFPPGPTDVIRIAPYNGGAGGADIGSIPNPAYLAGIQDIDYDSTNGILYILTGYFFGTPKVYGLDPANGNVVKGPVTMAIPGSGSDLFGPGSADGFTLLPNGHFLINNYTASCTYNQYDPNTGAMIPNTTITLQTSYCTGVDTDGIFLYFQTNFNSYTKTTMAGVVVASVPVWEQVSVYDISVQKGFAGVPGDPNCHGKTVSALTKLYGGMAGAATALGYQSESALQAAIWAWCGN